VELPLNSHNYETKLIVMARSCIDLQLPDELKNLVNSATELIRKYAPNSRVRENADLFAKVHIVPIDEFVEINGNIRVKVNAIETLAYKGHLSNVLIADLKPCKGIVKDKYNQLLNMYVVHVSNILTLFRKYLICGDVLNYLLWAYDKSKGEILIRQVINDYGINERSIMKILNKLFNMLICTITNNVLNKRYLHEMDVLSLGPLNDLSDKVLILIKVSEDCIYIGYL